MHVRLCVSACVCALLSESVTVPPSLRKCVSVFVKPHLLLLCVEGTLMKLCDNGLCVCVCGRAPRTCNRIHGCVSISQEMASVIPAVVKLRS